MFGFSRPTLLIMPILLITIVAVVPLHAAASSYDRVFSIAAAGQSYADIQVQYSFPDKATPGESFAIAVSLTYLQDENARADSVTVYGVTVNIALDHVSPSVVSVADNSSQRLRRGEVYSKKFTVFAPKIEGTYLVALAWKTYNPPVGGNPNLAGQRLWETASDAPSLVVSQPVSSTTTVSSSSSTTSSIPTTKAAPKVDYRPVVIAGIVTAGAVAILLVIMMGRRRKGREVAPVSVSTLTPPRKQVEVTCRVCGQPMTFLGEGADGKLGDRWYCYKDNEVYLAKEQRWGGQEPAVPVVQKPPAPPVGEFHVWVPILWLVGMIFLGFFSWVLGLLGLIGATIYVHYDAKKYGVESQAVLTLLLAIIGLPLHANELHKLRKAQQTAQVQTLVEPPAKPQPSINDRQVAEVAKPTKFCRECGAKIPRDSMFCEECGATLT